MDTEAKPETTEAEVEQLLGSLGRLRAEIGKAIIGQDETVEHLLVGLLAGGHSLSGLAGGFVRGAELDVGGEEVVADAVSDGGKRLRAAGIVEQDVGGCLEGGKASAKNARGEHGRLTPGPAVPVMAGDGSGFC